MLASRRLALPAALLALAGSSAFSACGGGEADARTEIAEVFDQVWAAVDEGDLGAICAHLGRNGRLQVISIGHTRRSSCEAGLGELVSGANAVGVREERPGPKIVDLDLTPNAPVATVRIDGRETKVPLVREDGRWKLDAMFGVGSGPSGLE